MLPRDFGREVDRTLLLELETRARRRPPAASRTSPAEFARAVSALRLATPGAIAAGPVIFERLDWRPYGVRPVPALAAQVPPGEPTRLDPFRAPLVAELQIGSPTRRLELLEALDRWELALFHEGSHRSDELREALEPLLGCDEGPWAAAMRAAVLLGETAREREELLDRAARADRRRRAGRARGGRAFAARSSRRCSRGSREALVAVLDEALLGLRPRPQVRPRRASSAAG